MEKLLINFVDFWGDFDKEDNLFINLLRNYYEVVISDQPEVLFYSCYGFEHLKFTCYKIFYTAENVRPSFRECDFSFSFDYNSYGGRNYRLPLYRFNGDLENLAKPGFYDTMNMKEKSFCCMVVSNSTCKFRNQFFDKLSKYKKVDSGGRFKNNIGYNVVDKVKFIQNYKFTLSFENSSSPGYTTEKLIEPFFSSSIPVYWGNPMIGNDFNTKSFINLHDYNSVEDAIEQIITIDKNSSLFESYLHEPKFSDGIFPEYLKWNSISEQLARVVKSSRHVTPVSKRLSYNLSYLHKYKKKLISRILNKPHWYC